MPFSSILAKLIFPTFSSSSFIMPPYSHIIFSVLQEILPAQSSSVFLPYKISPSGFIPRNIRRIPAPHPNLHSMLCPFRSRSPPLPVCPDKALSHMKENCIIRAACNAPRHFPYHCISLFMSENSIAYLFTKFIKQNTESALSTKGASSLTS